MACFNDLIRDISPDVLVEFILQAIKTMPKKTLLQLIEKLTEYSESIKGDEKDGKHTGNPGELN